MIEQLKEKQYQKLKQLMTSALEKAAPNLSPQEISDIREYIEHGEYGIGWELLLYLINKLNLEIPDEFIVCGREMGFDLTQLK